MWQSGRLIAAALAVGILWEGATARTADRYRPDVLVIKLKPQAAKTTGLARTVTRTGVRSLDELNVRLDIRDFHRIIPVAKAARAQEDVNGLGQYYIVQLAPGANLDSARAAYAADANVELAEPDYIEPMDMVPNDPEYGMQWTHSTSTDEDIDTQEAWGLEVGDSTVLVGVIDSGILFTHPDLAASIWVNPGEDLDGDGAVYDPDDVNGQDDDGDGYVDDFIGYDFMPAQGGCASGEDCNGPDNNPADIAGHGTHVNGIVAAATDNATGVAGIAGGQHSLHRPGVKLMGLRAGYLGSDSKGYVVMSACAAAMQYAVDHGACAVNCSWSSAGSPIRTAVLNAVAHGVVVCKSAGNDTSSVPDILDTTYGVLAVASLNRLGGHSPFTNYGSWVDISAPGEDIENTYSDMGVAIYASLSGTSMASPTVAGVAALLKSHHPWFTKTQIDTLLTKYVDDISAENPGFQGKLGSGRVNAMRALQILTTADFSADVTFGDAPLAVTFTNTSPNAPSGPYHYTFGDGGSAAVANSAHTYTLPGIYGITFTGSGPSGPHTRVRPEMIVVTRDTIDYADVPIDVGQSGAVPVRLHNTHPMKDIILPFKLTGPPAVAIDSLTLGPRLANWTATKVFDNSFNGQIAWRLRPGATGVPVPAGNGIIANFWVHVTGGNGGEQKLIDTATYGASAYTLRLQSDWANFKPHFASGSVRIPSPCICTCHGDPLCDGVIDILDVVSVIAVAFRGGADTIDPTCPHRGRSDYNCDCFVDILDVVRAVSKAFRGDTSPVCNPCLTPCS